MRTVGQFIKMVEGMEAGDSFEIDLRICPQHTKIKNQIKAYIEAGVLEPDEEYLEKYDERVRDRYRTGFWVAEEMKYRRKERRQ